MALFLFRFYPVLLPLILYLLWFYLVRSRALKTGKEPPKFSDAPIFLLLMSSFIIAIICFIVLGFSVVDDSKKGVYQPSHMEGDKLVPAQVVP